MKDEILRKLMDAAKDTRERAYAPYSSFKVGAALLFEDGEIISGCNVENSIYGRLIGQGLALWSCGPDRRSDTPDDILAW